MRGGVLEVGYILLYIVIFEADWCLFFVEVFRWADWGAPGLWDWDKIPCHSDGVAFFSETYFDVGMYECRYQIIVLDHCVTIQEV